MRLAWGVQYRGIVSRMLSHSAWSFLYRFDSRTTAESAHTVSVGLLGDQLKRRAPDLDCLVPASGDDHRPVGREADRPAAVCMRDIPLWVM